MNIEQVMSITPGQLKKMNRDELGRTVSVLASAGNKRLKRMEQAGVETRASKEVLRGGKFSVKNKNVTQLVEEAKRATKFLRSSTGGLGAKGTRKQTEKTRKPKTMSTLQLIRADVADLRKMTVEELKKELDKASDTANKRIKRMLESDVRSKTLTNVLENEGLFTSEGKTTKTDLINELKRAKQFLSNKGSTVTGQRRIQAKLERRVGAELTQSEVDTLWGAYNMLKETNKGIFAVMDSTQLQKKVNENLHTKSGKLRNKDTIYRMLNKELRKEYEAGQKVKRKAEKGNYTDVTEKKGRVRKKSDNVKNGANF